jgi:hypothetical protein
MWDTPYEKLLCKPSLIVEDFRLFYTHRRPRLAFRRMNSALKALLNISY